MKKVKSVAPDGATKGLAMTRAAGKAAKKRGKRRPLGRTAIGDRPMTATERKRRSRERDQAAAAYLALLARPGDAHEQTNVFIREAVSFLVDYGNRLSVWLKGTKLSREGKDALVRTLHQVANELMLLAQKVDGA